MTSEVAVAVAAAAAVLSLVLLGVVIRQHAQARAISRRVQDLEVDRREASAQIEELAQANRDTLHALELALQPPIDAPEETGSVGDEVRVITDISDRRRGVDGSHDDVDLTTARIASVTLGEPLIKVAAFSHGVRHALDGEQRMRISYAVRKELRRQRKMRRRRRGDQARSKGWG